MGYLRSPLRNDFKLDKPTLTEVTVWLDPCLSGKMLEISYFTA